ncbi:hypothetical protein V6N11_084374 [Hibiscus sabdariffa]|uniref:CCHC-type domain-containing protein n=1 Tax=Hibiscus sabdariffa TaxID=183260 RepID=A0ABR1ZJJ8_9ROSI
MDQPAPSPSYRDSLLRNQSVSHILEDKIPDDKDVELIEVVIKLLGHRIGYNTLCARLYDLWKLSQPFRLMDIGNDYFLTSFRTHSDYLNAITGGPWPHPSRIVAWIRLSGLPVLLYKPSFLTKIGKSIGPFVKLDYQTERGKHGRFARMAINLDLNKPLVSKLLINDHMQVIEYESLRTICFECGHYGHVQDICLTISNPMDIATGHVTPPVTVPTPDHEKATYGPWMMLDRRQRWSPRTTIPTVSTSMDVTVSGSRFNPIFEEEILEQPHNSEANIVDPVPLQVQRPTGVSSVKVPPKLVRKGSSLSSNCSLTASSRMSMTINSTHTVVVISENVDPNVINAVVTDGPQLSRRLEPPDHSVVDATLPQTVTLVKILGIGHVANQPIRDSMTMLVHDVAPMCNMEV